MLRVEIEGEGRGEQQGINLEWPSCDWSTSKAHPELSDVLI